MSRLISEIAFVYKYVGNRWICSASHSPKVRSKLFNFACAMGKLCYQGAALVVNGNNVCDSLIAFKR